jgi:hypothetical protein
VILYYPSRPGIYVKGSVDWFSMKFAAAKVSYRNFKDIYTSKMTKVHISLLITNNLKTGVGK